MLLLIDNYDSFTYNVVHYLGELGADVIVRRNDALSLDEAMGMKPSGIVLAPGPCDPDKAGICLKLTAEAARTETPLLGTGHPLAVQGVSQAGASMQRVMPGLSLMVKGLSLAGLVVFRSLALVLVIETGPLMAVNSLEF